MVCGGPIYYADQEREAPQKSILKHRAGIKRIPQLQKADFIIAVIVDLELAQRPYIQLSCGLS